MADKKTYSIAIDGIKQSVDGVQSLGKAVNTNVTSMKDLKQALKATKDEMAGLDKSTKQWQDLAKVAGDYKDRIDDINQATKRWASDTKAVDDLINVTQSAVSTMTLAKGAMSALGVSTEDAVEQIKELQEAMAVIKSLQTLNNTLKGSSVSAELLTKSMNILSLGIKGTTTATKALRAVTMSLGIGLLIGLIAALVEHWDDLKRIIKENIPIVQTISDKFNGLKGIIFGVGNAIKVALMTPFEKLGKAFMKLIKGDFKGAISELTSGWGDAWEKIKKGFWDGVAVSKQTNEEKKKDAKKTNKAIKDDTQKMLDDIVKYEKKARDEIQKLREEEYRKEKERLERLKKLKKDDAKAEQDYQKQKLKLDLAYATSEEEKIRIKKEIIALDQKIAEENVKAAAADTMGISISELEQRLTMTDEKWMGLNEEQKQVLQTLITQLATIKMAAEEAKQGLSSSSTSSSSSSSSEKEKKNPYTQKWHELIYGGDGTQDEMSEKAQQLAEAVGTAYQETIGPVFDGVMNLGDAIHQAMEFAIEEAEEALEEAEQMHDEAVEKVSESKDRISDLNDKMKESSGAQLEAYKQQMADEMLLLNQREMEERRLQKEKEKREKELEKQKKKQRKLELQQQLIQAIVSGALAVVNGLATQPFMPVGIAMGALAGVATAIQIATITKQMSKLADGGLLSGKSHSQGGIPVGSTGIEVEGGEYVVNKRSTAKYLPLLQQINEEGARRKTVANQIGKYADGGELNFERINSNMDALNTAKMVSAALGSIEMHPVVSVVDINRGQRNYAEVRQLAGAN